MSRSLLTRLVLLMIALLIGGATFITTFLIRSPTIDTIFLIAIFAAFALCAETIASVLYGRI